MEKNIVDQPDFYTRHSGGFFVVGDIDHLMVQQNERQDGNYAENQYHDHVEPGHGQVTSNIKESALAWSFPDADDGNGGADAQGKHDGENQIGILFEIAAQKFNQRAADRGKDKCAQDRILIGNQPDCDAGQRSVGIMCPLS
jgi:hypothetical protein